MKYYYVGIGILIIIVLFFSVITKNSEVKKTELKENPYDGLRNMVFSLNAKSLGCEVNDPKQSLCTVMEWKISDATSTLVSVIDGSTSIYLSSGGGVIGGGAHKKVVDVSSVFIKESEKYLDLMKKDMEHILPQQGHVSFYIVTIDGVYKYEGKEEEMTNGKDKFSKLFMNAQNVITELRKIAQ